MAFFHGGTIRRKRKKKEEKKRKEGYKGRRLEEIKKEELEVHELLSWGMQREVMIEHKLLGH